MQKNTTHQQDDLPVLDLHGEEVHPAWNMFKDFANECFNEGDRKARVITGKGKIFKEFTHWATNHPKVTNVFLEPSGGSFLIKFPK